MPTYVSSDDCNALLQGALNLLILKTLALRPVHGWGEAQRVPQISDQVLQIGQGSLHTALHRLESREWIQAEWRSLETNRCAQSCSLNVEGHRQPDGEVQDSDRMAGAIVPVLCWSGEVTA